MEKSMVDFLVPDINQIRHTISGIDDSYNNSWDIYAELIQNAVDAIRQHNVEKGLIEIEIDCPSKAIIIKDNGMGIDKLQLPFLLRPFATNKSGVDAAIGEKGVGLKFVIFSSNFFYIKSGDQKGSSEAEIVGANSWKKSADSQHLSLGYSVLDDGFLGTTVEVRGVENETIFNLSFDQLVYVLRSRTAVGTTRPIWGSDKEIEIRLKYNDINSVVSETQIPFKYWLVTDQIPQNSKIDLEEFEEWLGQGDRTDLEKMSKLKDKVIYKKGEFKHANQRVIRYFACFVPKRRVWNDLSIRLNLANEENLEDDNWLNDYYFTKLNGGIYVSVKGMPTGISIEHPTTGSAGYWSNTFMIFEDPFVKFDIGRKSIHGRQANIHREYAKIIFREFLTFVTKYVSGDIVIEPAEWNKDEIFAEIDKLIDLNIEGIKFQKAPSSQEASVAAIFFEAIGTGKIKNITPLVSGYRNRYDLYALWDRKKLLSNLSLT